jgi:hypothetical protein
MCTKASVTASTALPTNEAVSASSAFSATRT